jgi:hypothetical protein
MSIVSALSCLLLVSEYGAGQLWATAARLVVVRTQGGQSVELAPAQRLQQDSYACVAFDVKATPARCLSAVAGATWHLSPRPSLSLSSTSI